MEDEVFGAAIKLLFTRRSKESLFQTHFYNIEKNENLCASQETLSVFKTLLFSKENRSLKFLLNSELPRTFLGIKFTICSKSY